MSEAIDLGLKAKGIGPRGLKPLGDEQYEAIANDITNGTVDPRLAAAFLMGFWVLERDPQQIEALRAAFKGKAFPHELEGLLPQSLNSGATGARALLPLLMEHRELDARQCVAVVDELLDGEDEILKACLLQGLRVKRETPSENIHLHRQLLERSKHLTRPGWVVDLSEPYDGMNRSPSIVLEMAVLLSCLGVPTVLHSVKGLGPKLGETVLDHVSGGGSDLAGGDRALDEVGVAILDQALVFPELSRLRPLRNAIRKRPFLATFEKMLMPIRGKEGSLMVTGYVHRDYKEHIPHVLESSGLSDNYLLFKGMEGGVSLDPKKKNEVLSFGSKRRECTMDALEVNEAEMEGDWWKKRNGMSELRLLKSVQGILEFGLGRVGSEFTIESMRGLIDSGRFDSQRDRVLAYYA